MPVDPLFVLIQRLSKSEKRYFKLFSSLQKGPETQKYLQLFDFLASEPEYDLGRLAARFPDPRFLNRLSSEKDYLYRQILRAMRQYRQKSSPAIEIQNLIQDGGFLFEKALYKASSARFRKAAKLADKMEDHLAQLEILIWQSQLAHLNPEDRSAIPNKLAQAKESLEALQHRFQLLQRYNELRDLVAGIQDLRQEAHQKALAEILDDPLLDPEARPRGFESIHLYHQIVGTASLLTGKWERAIQAYRDLVAHWESAPHLLKASPTRFKQVLSVLAQRLLQRGATEEAQTYLERIRRSKEVSLHDRFQVRQMLLFEEMLLFLNQKDLKALALVLPEITHWLEEFGDLLQAPRRVSFYANVALSYFLLSDFKTALEYLNQLLNEHRGANRQDVQYFARMLELLLHHELGNDDLLEYAIRTVHQFLKRRKALHAFEKSFLTHFQAVHRQGTPEKVQQAFEAMAAEMEKVPAGELIQIPGGTILYIWLLGKAQGRPIGEQYQLYDPHLGEQ